MARPAKAGRDLVRLNEIKDQAQRPAFAYFNSLKDAIEDANVKKIHKGANLRIINGMRL